MAESIAEGTDTKEQSQTAILLGGLLLILGVSALVDGDWAVAISNTLISTCLFIRAAFGSQTSTGDGWPYWITLFSIIAAFGAIVYDLLG